MRLFTDRRYSENCRAAHNLSLQEQLKFRLHLVLNLHGAAR